MTQTPVYTMFLPLLHPTPSFYPKAQIKYDISRKNTCTCGGHRLADLD